MPDYLIVLIKIMAMFLAMAAGWFARRHALLNDHVTRVLSRLIVDIIFPCMVFSQMVRTLDAAALQQSWISAILGGGMIALGIAIGWVMLPWLYSSKKSLPTAIFLAGSPNWVFLPLPIVAALYGDAGVREILCFNAGAQLALWTIGVWTLQGARPNRTACQHLLRNPGLIATVGGILIALFYPQANMLENAGITTLFDWRLPVTAALQAMSMLGDMTIPLSLLVTGAQLASIKKTELVNNRDLTAVLAARLLAAPLLTMAALIVFAKLGFGLPAITRVTCFLIAAMPVAISAGIMAERFDGDKYLSARAIFWSTAVSMLTVPVLYWLAQSIGAI